MKKLLKISLVLLMPLSLLIGCSSKPTQDQIDNTNTDTTSDNSYADASVWKNGEITINGTKIVMPLENASSLTAIGFTSEALETNLPKRTYDEVTLKSTKGGSVVAKIINGDVEGHFTKDCRIESLLFEKKTSKDEIVFPGKMTWDTTFDEMRKAFGEPKYEDETKSRLIYSEAGGTRIEVDFSSDGKINRYFIKSDKFIL